VEIVRSRRDAAAAFAVPEPRPTATVLLVPFDADPSSFVSARQGAPLVLVPRAAIERPVAATMETQRRIDLLALDQVAWALASRHKGLTVAASRTELDWVIRRGLPCVWAPSRLALDSPGAPRAADGLRLAAWLASELKPSRIEFVGHELPLALDEDATAEPVEPGAPA
jgi:dihydroneopterin aldolase